MSRKYKGDLLDIQGRIAKQKQSPENTRLCQQSDNLRFDAQVNIHILK
jgi:hypothetical protein